MTTKAQHAKANTLTMSPFQNENVLARAKHPQKLIVRKPPDLHSNKAMNRVSLAKARSRATVAATQVTQARRQ
jgi:hypothetical protein